MSPDAAQATKATETWFIRRGLPHFVFQYAATRNVLPRLVPLVALVFVLEVAVVAPNRRYSALGSAAAVLGGLAVLVGVWALVNVLRGRHALRLPHEIGLLEVVVFVVGPSVVPLAFGGQWRSALATGAINAALLVSVVLVTSYGLVPMTRWVVEQGVHQARSVTGVLVRALPLMFLIVIVVFVNTEAWQVASDLHWPVLGIVCGLFLMVGAVFAFIRVPGQIGEIEAGTWAERFDLASDSPAAPLVEHLGADLGEPPRLSRREWRNVLLVVLVSEGILVAVVGLGMFAFFVVLGVFAITPGVIETWIGRAPDLLWSFRVFGEDLAITGELLKVCTFLAAFSALQFTVSLVSSGDQQEEYLHQLRDELRDAFAVRAVYLVYVLEGVRESERTPTTISPT
ncbi:MAG TPA: hypothetical protein VMX12_10200 [Acidimicrobiia bacterium]|nr:hypothetical protein [Acidimicrobiia bacterium]